MFIWRQFVQKIKAWFIRQKKIRDLKKQINAKNKALLPLERDIAFLHRMHLPIHPRLQDRLTRGCNEYNNLLKQLEKL